MTNVDRTPAQQRYDLAMDNSRSWVQGGQNHALAISVMKRAEEVAASVTALDETADCRDSALAETIMNQGRIVVKLAARVDALESAAEHGNSGYGQAETDNSVCACGHPGNAHSSRDCQCYSSTGWEYSQCSCTEFRPVTVPAPSGSVMCTCGHELGYHHYVALGKACACCNCSKFLPELGLGKVNADDTICTCGHGRTSHAPYWCIVKGCKCIKFLAHSPTPALDPVLVAICDAFRAADGSDLNRRFRLRLAFAVILGDGPIRSDSDMMDYGRDAT